MSAQFDRGGDRVVTASVDKTVRVWDLKSGVNTRVFSAEGAAVDFAAFSPDGRYVLAACSDHVARLWNVHTGTLVVRLLGHREKLRSAVYDATGQRIPTEPRVCGGDRSASPPGSGTRTRCS